MVVLIALAFAAGGAIGYLLGASVEGLREPTASMPTGRRTEAIAASREAVPAAAPARTEVGASRADPAAIAARSLDSPLEPLFSATISGIVRDGLGQPLAGASVQAFMAEGERKELLERWQAPDDETSQRPFLARARTRSDGTFRLIGLQPGAGYEVLARASSGPARGWTPLPQDATTIIAPAQDVDIRLRECYLDIQLVPPDPIAADAGHMWFEVSWWETRGWQAGQRQRVQQPRFRIDVAPGIAYTVALESATIRPVTLSHLIVSTDEVVKHVSVPLQAWTGNEVVIDVVDDRDRPVPDVEFLDITETPVTDKLRLRSEYAAPKPYPDRTAGGYRFVNLAPGPRTLIASPPRSSGLCGAPIQVLAPETGVAKLHVQLARGAKVRLHIAGSTPVMPTLCTSGSHASRDRWSVSWDDSSRTCTAAQPLPPGAYDLWLAFPGAEGGFHQIDNEWDLTLAATFTLAAGETKELDVPMPR